MSLFSWAGGWQKADRFVEAEISASDTSSAAPCVPATLKAFASRGLFRCMSEPRWSWPRSFGKGADMCTPSAGAPQNRTTPFAASREQLAACCWSYWALATCGAGLFISTCALTFWICAACSFTVAVRAATSFFSSCTVRCSLRNSLSNIAFTAS